MVQVMKTDNGPHPSSYWAETTVNEIVKIEPTASGAEQLAAEALRTALKTALVEKYDDLKNTEASELDADPEYIVTDIRPGDDVVEDVVAGINTVVQASQFADHFAQPNVQDYLRRVVAQHFATAKDVERSWHADRNPNDPVVKAYRKARSEHGMLNVHVAAKAYRNKD